ncbi:MAG TPA: NAD(P)/FAD-dependent oxidoreductase [Bacteroidales bacterium]|nr:NAD(P)/FAD-dependent oxidoreductase [Bacteroidales bacterium]HPS17971.1 NAD(P)/FAD-dependent oxidoreductase [Bacteroidales bacterium]
MKKQIELAFTPEQFFHSENQKNIISKVLHVDLNDITGIRLVRRSLDARKQKIVYRCQYDVFISELPEQNKFDIPFKNVTQSPVVIIAGAGPAGLFAALKCIELGMKPVIIERGKSVHDRRYDITNIHRERLINPDSNYCFGEGGAGTFSDGKLYTRSTKRGDVNRILQLFYMHGASAEILYDSHPHIGTDKLPPIIAAIRQTIEEYGGMFHFENRIVDIKIKDNSFESVVTSKGNEYHGKALILATGHSARDIFYLLERKKIFIEPSSFAVGFRVEHPQQIIDEIQYHQKSRGKYLPASAYSLAGQFGGKGVFSFCMCPGGTIVDSSTSQDELVLNGMSNSRRNQPFANSGIVVTVNENDFKSYGEGALSGLQFQKMLENIAFVAGGSNHFAPAQRMSDFCENKISSSFNTVSYRQGITSAPLSEIFPKVIISSIQEAFTEFDKKMKGFYTNEATLFAVESRTSSPVRITRDAHTLEHIQIKNLFPCGEGAGYAGGIVSSAIDGERVAEAVAKKIL